jgi:integrase/recombinase XerC
MTRLVSAFLAGRGPHTTDAYQRDLADFTHFLRRHTAAEARPLIGSIHTDTDALRWWLKQTPGRANEVAHAYRADLLTRRLSTGTASRRISVLKSLCKFARMSGLVTWTIEIAAPRIEHSLDTRGPTLTVIQAMLTIAASEPSPTSQRDTALLRLAFDLGLRVSELARLDLSDVEMKTGGLWVLGKGRRAKELLTMPQTSRDAIRAWLAVRGTSPNGPLLLSFSRANLRQRLTSRGVYRIIRDLGAAAGVHVRPHGIRHTAITQAIDAAAKQGLSIDVVRQFSRHRTIGTLLVYRDQHENKQRQLAEWVSATVAPPGQAQS